MLSSRAVTVSQCCNAESALTAQALLLRWCADSLGCASSRGLFVCLFVRSFVCLLVFSFVRSFSRLVFSFGSCVRFVRFHARLGLRILSATYVVLPGGDQRDAHHLRVLHPDGLRQQDAHVAHRRTHVQPGRWVT